MTFTHPSVTNSIHTQARLTQPLHANSGHANVFNPHAQGETYIYCEGSSNCTLVAFHTDQTLLPAVSGVLLRDLQVRAHLMIRICPIRDPRTLKDADNQALRQASIHADCRYRR